jgi:BlaI family transcriptional regulator, penicillinase repressor
MAKPFASLGEFELQVLRLVWQNQPCTERQISDLVLQERTVARTTVLKTMQRMEAKRILERVPGDSPVRFRATVSEKQMVPDLVGGFVERMLGGSLGPLVAYLADSQKLTEKDMKALRTIAQKIGEEPSAGKK